MSKKKVLHYGKALRKAIEQKGFTKVSVCQKLKISKPTLYTRFKDGEFKDWQKKIIKDFYL